MAFGGFGREGGAAPMGEINMIPLIDVMLVLLVIFIITAPLLTHAVKVDLPKASSRANVTQPDNVQVAIDAGPETTAAAPPATATASTDTGSPTPTATTTP